MDRDLTRSDSDDKSTLLLQVTIYILFGLGPLTGNVILVLFGILSNEFGVVPTTVAIAIPAFMFPFAFIQLFSGAVSDLKGRIPVIIFGLIVFSIGMLIAMFSISLNLYVVANILGGIGFGFVNPVLIALMTDLSKSTDIPKKMGFLGAVANLGVGLGPILAGQLVIISWRLLYLLFILIVIFSVINLLIIRKENKTRTNRATNTEFKTFLKNLGFELKRPVVILLVLTASFASLSYLGVITWTSQALTHSIPENLAGIIIGLAGIFGTISGITTGLLIKKIGVKIAIITGIISLFISLLILMNTGDVASFEKLPLVSLGFIFSGIAGGTFIPTVMFYSQTLSLERRGTLAGLATTGQFVGTALVPIIYEPFFNQEGILLVYFIIVIVAILLTIILGSLYLVSKRK